MKAGGSGTRRGWERALGTGSGRLPAMNCYCPLLPWLQDSQGPSEFSRCLPGGEEWEKVRAVLLGGTVHAGTFVLRGF